MKRPIEVSNRYHLLACDPTDHQVSSRDAIGGASGASMTAPALLNDNHQGRQSTKITANTDEFPEKDPKELHINTGNWRPTMRTPRTTMRKLEVQDNEKKVWG